jgi:hypothetical protein
MSNKKFNDEARKSGSDKRRYDNEQGTWEAKVKDGKLDWENAVKQTGGKKK